MVGEAPGTEAPPIEPAAPKSVAPSDQPRPGTPAPALANEPQRDPEIAAEPVIDLDHPTVKAAIAAAAEEAARKSAEATLAAERERVAEEQRKAALTEDQRRAEEQAATKAAAEKAQAEAARATLERDMVSSLAAAGRVIPPGDRRMGVVATIVSEMIAADPTLTVQAAVAKALADPTQAWIADAIGGTPTPKPSTSAPVPPAPTHVPQPPKPKDASEMTKAEWQDHLAQNGIRLH